MQTWIAQHITGYLSDKLGTKVNIASVEIKFFRRLILHDMLVEDLSKDTLFFAHKLDVRLSLFQPWDNKLRIARVDLHDTHIYLHKAVDSTRFNFEFITDQFTNGPNDTTPSKPFDLSFKEVYMHGLNFNLLNEPSQNQLTTKLAFLGLTADKVNFENKHCFLDDLRLDSAQVAFRDYRPYDTTKRHNDTLDRPEKVKEQVAEMLNADCWDLRLAHLSINGSFFSFHKENYPLREKGMDYDHIVVSGIDIDMNNARLVDDSLFVRVNNISAKERSGFTLKHLEADAKIAPNIMEFKKLHVITPESNITDYYAMEYEHISDFGKYEEKVTMTGKFKRAKVSIKDINYYAHALTPIDHNIVNLSGYVRGTVSNLKGRDLLLECGDHSVFNGNVSFKGLPKINETFISGEVKKVRTDVADLLKIYPEVPHLESMRRLGVVWFSGRFDGFINDFVADGELISSIGRVKSDINFKIDEGKPYYSGNLSTTEFDMGTWLNQDYLGKMTMRSKVEGSGFNLKVLEANGDGIINSITVKDYVYRDIRFDGIFKQNEFKGYFSVKDDNLDLDFEGDINLAQQLPVFKFHSLVTKANLKALNLTDSDIKLSTDMSLDLIGDKIDSINGSFTAKHTNIIKDDSLYVLDSLQFYSFDNPDGKALVVTSDFLEASMNGRFNFKDLPNALGRFFKYYFEPTTRGTEQLTDSIRQNFEFNIAFDNTGNLSRLLHKDLANIEEGTINGFFNSSDNSFELNSDIRGATFKKFRMADITVNAASNADKVDVHAYIDTVFMKDSIFTQWLRLDAGIDKDTMLFKFAIQQEDAPNNMVLNGKLSSDLQKVWLTLLPSKVVINNEAWNIQENNSLYYDSTMFAVKNLKLYKGDHFFTINTYNPPGRSHLNVEFENINIEEVIPGLEIMAGHRLMGVANGYFTITDVLKDPKLIAMADLSQFSIDGDVLGDLQMTGSFVPTEEKISLNGRFKGGLNDIGINGSYDLASKDNYLNIDFNIEKAHLPHIEHFASNFVSRVAGTAKGYLHVGGTFEKPVLTGQVTAYNGGATVNYLGSHYTFDQEEIDFTKEGIALKEITLKDAKGNLAKATGTIYHQNLKDFNLDIDIKTDNFQFLNTTEKMNGDFFGEVYAGGLVTINGPLNDVQFYAAATTKKNTKFSIAVNNAKDVDKYNFFRFIQKDTVKNKQQIAIRSGGVSVDFDLDITPDAQINLIMSPTDGDVITATGRGNMKVQFDKNGDFTMVGRYEIEKGQYLFSLQKVISKNFEIAKGSEILWTGDPYDARLAIKAIYKLRAAPYDLIEDVLKEDAPKQQSKNRIPVYLELKLAGSLLSPDINFDIDVPNVDQGIRSALDSKLALVRQDQNELNKQVVGLLVLNRFLPVIPLGSSVNSNIAQGVNNTVSEFVSNQLSIYLTDWISKFITEVQLDINYRNYQSQTGDGSNTGGGTDESTFENRRELQLALTKSFFNDRIEVDIGGNFDFGQNQNTSTSNTTTNAITGDFEIRYNITPDGRIKVKVFRKGQYDIFQDRNLNRTGVGVSYRKEFDTVKDLFENLRSKRKRKNQDKELPFAPQPVIKDDELAPELPPAAQK
ncbi:MAG: translocation/assembly module TamB domain-containing protein [Chitinophagales bacterium]|nr:translocation/assembly module TamB domain-containing protein [Chitinophagales bacterium]